jgi:hypothetical protein
MTALKQLCSLEFSNLSWLDSGISFGAMSGDREPVFSVMAAGWFCEKSGWIGKVEDVKPMLLNTKWNSTGNHFEEEDFRPVELWNRWISSGLIHRRPYIIWLEGLSYLSVVDLYQFGEWWTCEAFASLLHFIISLHWITGLLINPQVLGRLSLHWRRNEPSLEKKRKILAGPNECQEVCNRSNPENTKLWRGGF